MSTGTSSDIVRVSVTHPHSPGASQSSGVLLPKRPKQHNHQSSLRRKHRRSHTAPQYTEQSLSSCSTSSLHSEGDTRRSSCSSDTRQGVSSRPFSCHISCRVSPDRPGYFEYLRPYSVFRSPLKQCKSLPSCFTDSYTMQHPDLDNGQKTYLWHTASVYSMSNMKVLQQRRYKQLLQHQVDIGFHTQEECDRYLQYLLKTRKRQFNADPNVWREPQKIPVRQKSFRVPPPSKGQSYRDYRYYPRGYEDASKGQDEEGKSSSLEKTTGDIEDDHQKDSKEQTDGKGHTKDNGQTDSKGYTEKEACQSDDRGHTKGKGQTDGKGNAEDKGEDDEEKAKDGNKEDSRQDGDTKSDSDNNQDLSESMQGLSLYYDPRRKTTVTRGKEEGGDSQKEGGNEEDIDKSKGANMSHQNCFWGSH